MEKHTLYKAYIKEKKQKEKNDKTIKKYNLSSDKNTIVINQNSNKIIKFLSLIIDVFVKILKLTIIVGIVGLVTIGATVVLNKELLNYILNFMGG
ncbi:MAG: hypothetical protein HFJ53_03250 [Clostridia bacterium]|jgi:hypothetical protein|nr:hypothetical protein [Clostridia bacterium]